MKRTYLTYTQQNINPELEIEQIIRITYRPIKRIKMNEKSSNKLKAILPSNFSQMTAPKKGQWLEEEIQRRMSKLEFNITITKSTTWEKNPEKPHEYVQKIIGDNGIDGIARRRIEGEEYRCIIQAKCYAKTTTISTDVISHLENNVRHLEAGKAFGLLVVLHKESLNERAWSTIKNASCPIIVIDITQMDKLVELIKNIKWEDYPLKSLKRTFVEVESAEELKQIGNLKIDARKLKNLKYREEVIQ
jgi:hypothetical protein